MSISFTQTISNGKLLVKIFTTQSASSISNFSLNASYTTSGVAFDDISFPGSSSSSSSASLLGSTGNFTISASVALAPAVDGAIATITFTGSGQGSFDLNVTSLKLNGVAQTIQDSPSFSYDLTPPSAVTFSPADGATGVVIGTDIVVTFSEAIQRGTGNLVLKTAAGVTVETYNAATSGNLSISGSTLTINPTVDLAYGTSYKIEFVAGTIKDLAGNSYVGTTSYDFTTLASSGNDLPTGAVSIAGYPNIGQTLAASNTLSDLDGLGSITYQWSATGSPISGATGTTFTLTQDQVGKTITVAASYTDGFGTPESVTSNATGAVTNIPSQIINGTTAIIRSDLVIFGTYKLTAATQVASGVKITVLPGSTLDLGGFPLLNYGTISLEGNSTTFAVLRNGTYETDSTSGALITSYGNLKSVVVDGFFSNGKLQITNSLIEDSRIDALESNSISKSIFKSSPLAIGTESITIDQVTFSDSQVSASTWPYLDQREISNSNFVGASPVIYLSPFVSGYDHSLKITGSYIRIPTGSNFESMVYDATDDLRVKTDLVAATFLTTPITNNSNGFNVGAYTFPLSLLLPQLIGTTGNDNLVGTTGADSILGLDGADILTGAGGNDIIDGGAGIDIAIFSVARANYTVTKIPNGYMVAAKTGNDGTDTLTNVERLKFSDFSVALDVSGNLGTTAKILGAVFGKTAVANKEYAGIGLQLLDAGMSYLDLMQLALNAKLGAGASNATVVDLLYKNVVGTPPPASELALYQGLLDSGAHTRASLGVLAADTVLNTVNINLVGLAVSGLEYLSQG